MKTVFKIVLVLIFTLNTWVTYAGEPSVAVVVNPSNSSAISNKDIELIYLGKKKSFSDGSPAVPVALPDESPVTQNFHSEAIRKTESQLKSYWAALIFNGKGTPPQVLDSSAEVKQTVANNPNIIGFIHPDDIDDSVKLVATF